MLNYKSDLSQDTLDFLGYIHKDELPEQEKVQDYIIGIKESLYVNGNIEWLEDCVEELCCLFNVSFERKDLKVEQKQGSCLRQWHLGYQIGIIDATKNKNIHKERTT